MSEEEQEPPRRALVCGCDEQLAGRVAKLFPEWLVERAANNNSLLAMLETGSAELILTDRETPAKDDVALLRRIRADRSNANIRVIILAAKSSREDVIAAMRHGAFSYFSRPYFEAAFDEILRHAGSDSPWEDSLRVDSATPAWLRVFARCEMATADRLIQFMNEVSDLTGKNREEMGFALKEILMNAMEYGGKFNRDRLVEVSYVRGKRMVLYRVRDPGDGFSLEELTHAAISNPPEEPVKHLEIRDSMGIRPGGYGVLLSRKLVDDLIYSERGNDVLLIKYVDLPVGEGAGSFPRR